MVGDTDTLPDAPYTEPTFGDIVSEVQLPFVVQESCDVPPTDIVLPFAVKLVIVHDVGGVVLFTVTVTFLVTVPPVEPWPVIT